MNNSSKYFNLHWINIKPHQLTQTPQQLSYIQSNYSIPSLQSSNKINSNNSYSQKNENIKKGKNITALNNLMNKTKNQQKEFDKIRMYSSPQLKISNDHLKDNISANSLSFKSVNNKDKKESKLCVYCYKMIQIIKFNLHVKQHNLAIQKANFKKIKMHEKYNNQKLHHQQSTNSLQINSIQKSNKQLSFNLDQSWNTFNFSNKSGNRSNQREKIEYQNQCNNERQIRMISKHYRYENQDSRISNGIKFDHESQWKQSIKLAQKSSTKSIISNLNQIKKEKFVVNSSDSSQKQKQIINSNFYKSPINKNSTNHKIQPIHLLSKKQQQFINYNYDRKRNTYQIVTQLVRQQPKQKQKLPKNQLAIYTTIQSPNPNPKKYYQFRQKY